MKKCKKCGAIIADENNVNVCNECKQKTNKILAPMLVVGATAITYVLLKEKIFNTSVKKITDITENVVMGMKNNSNPLFGGISQRTLDKMAKDTFRGVKAVVQGDTLEYFYKSASGKTINSAMFKFDEAGKLVGYLGDGPYNSSNSPRFFCEKVLEKILTKK